MAINVLRIPVINVIENPPRVGIGSKSEKRKAIVATNAIWVLTPRAKRFLGHLEYGDRRSGPTHHCYATDLSAALRRYQLDFL
jgi:hypothetical protein